ncbi:MAG TPA: tetratricopeptide repeat protein [Candidatus Angelobacter sp.]|nr:tetratricopeptide repeat protein [Candidatus Angelobacter sp.]
MRNRAIPILLASAFLGGCAAHHKPPATQGTLADLHSVAPDVKEAETKQSVDQAMEQYRKFLNESPETPMTPEAIRRLADLELEKEYGIHTGDNKKPAMPAPQSAKVPASTPAKTSSKATAVAGAGHGESDQEFERRTTAENRIPASGDTSVTSTEVPGTDAAPKGPLEAIALYKKLLTEYPQYKDSDQVLYQMARAYDELGRTDEAMETMERAIKANPNSVHFDEVQFRRGEYFFTRRKFRDAENAYSAITNMGPRSSYYELALYKLGWTFYKQELYEEAVQNYMALLDYKVSSGYNFDEKHQKEDERRVADTFRAVSLSFSNLGGPEAVQQYFASTKSRSYEDRIYGNLGEHYLTKLRYDDAAKTFKAFIALHPFHPAAPRFSMRVVETFTKGGFPKLVLEAKRDFASKYGLQAEYWQHNKPEESPEALAYLKTDLKDLATHYHAEYQSSQDANEKLTNYQEAQRWYGDYLKSFPKDPESPAINYRLADLLFENKDFGQAAKQYERTAYEYPVNAQSPAAGYAAVYAYREQMKVVAKENLEAVKHDTVASSLKFADTFPTHAQAAAVLGAAADDQYEMKDFRAAVTSAQRVIDKYPGAEKPIRRSAWIVVAHGSFELADYPQAEKAYTQVLMVTPEGDESHAKFVDNLAASIYKQGELARNAQDYRAAADHFLRIRTAAPTSTIRPTAEYDAGAALIELKDWKNAASVLEAFRSNYPKHKMAGEATRLIARAYREGGELSHAASEYERLASESTDETVRRESLLMAGDLYQQSNANDKALIAYQHYVTDFPKPLETAVETHFKMAEIHKAAHDDSLYQKELKEIVSLDAAGGAERTGRTKTLAARSALVLAEQLYQAFVAVKLRQPFETSLKEKKERMDATINAMSGLVNYEIADVTSAATFYMAETYFDFSRSLKESERPADMKGADLEKFEADLDEAAYPFEDKAIKVHEKNMEMLHAGVFNAWTQKSLSRLAELVPGRYAKNEMSSGFIGAIDHYVYRSPLAQAAIQAAAASNAGTTPTNGGTAPANAGTTPNNTSTTPSNSGTAPSNTDQTTQPTPGAGTTPSEPEQTTQPTPMAVNQGAVTHANPQ